MQATFIPAVFLAVSLATIVLLPLFSDGPPGPPTEPYATGLDDDEISGDLLVTEATQPCLETRVERLDGPVVGEAGHDDPVMRAKGKPHEVREAEVGTEEGEPVCHRVAKDSVIGLTPESTIADVFGSESCGG